MKRGEVYKESHTVVRVKTVLKAGPVGWPPRSPYFDITTYGTLCARRNLTRATNKKTFNSTHIIK